MYQVFPDRFARSAAADARELPEWALAAEWDDPVIHEGPGPVTQLYGGDLDGVREHLDHLLDLGVTMLYLTPVFPARSNHRYDAHSFDHVDPLLGGDDALVAGGRLALAFVVCHLIGRAYSVRVLNWFGQYLGYRREQMDALISGFDRVDWAIVPWFTGSNLVAAISGVRRMNPIRLAVLLTIGLVGRILLYWWIGQVFDDQLADILDWIGRYQWPLTIVSILLVLVTVGLNLRRGKAFSGPR